MTNKPNKVAEPARSNDMEGLTGGRGSKTNTDAKLGMLFRSECKAVPTDLSTRQHQAPSRRTAPAASGLLIQDQAIVLLLISSILKPHRNGRH